MGRSNTNLSKWGYADTADTACECGTSEQTMQHLLRCPLLENECSLEDLATANEKALHCARAWPNIWLNSEMMDTKEEVPNTGALMVNFTGSQHSMQQHHRMNKELVFIIYNWNLSWKYDFLGKVCTNFLFNETWCILEWTSNLFVIDMATVYVYTMYANQHKTTFSFYHLPLYPNVRLQ